MKTKTTIRRVRKGDSASKRIGCGDFTRGVIPADGFIVSTNVPYSVSAYVSDADIESALALSKIKDESVEIEAESWD